MSNYDLTRQLMLTQRSGVASKVANIIVRAALIKGSFDEALGNLLLMQACFSGWMHLSDDVARRIVKVSPRIRKMIGRRRWTEESSAAFTQYLVSAAVEQDVAIESEYSAMRIKVDHWNRFSEMQDAADYLSHGIQAAIDRGDIQLPGAKP